MSPFLFGCTSGTGGGSGGGVGNLSGYVLDVQYAAISNADVVVGDSTTKSLSNGHYSFTNIPAGTKTIKITSPTHTSAYRRVSLGGGQSVSVDPVFLSDLDGKVTSIPAIGGIASNTDGSIKIKFRSGSFSSATDVVVTAVPMISAPFNSPTDQQFISIIVYAKPEDASLGANATLLIPNLTNVTTEGVTFYRFNPNSYDWESIGIGYASAETNTINIETTYLGWIAAIVPINPAPGTISGTVNIVATTTPIFGANIWTQNSYSTTNSSGYYKLLNVPTGTVTVFASAAEYDPHTSSPLTVESLSDTSHSFTMVPKDTGNISGTVKSRQDLRPIVGARVVETGGSVAFTNTNGIYTLYNINTGTVSVFAYADNYASSGEGITVSGGSTATLNFLLPFTGAINTYDFTFESDDAGFTYTGQWHRQYSNPVESLRPLNYFNSAHSPMPRKVILPDAGYLPAARTGGVGSNNYYMWYGKDSPSTREGSYIGFQDYSDILSTSDAYSGGISILIPTSVAQPAGTLESPTINLTGYTYATLSFWTWWEVEGKNPATGFDKMGVMVKKTTDTDWTILGYINPFEDPAKSIVTSYEAYTSGGYNTPGIWVKHNIDLTQYSGNNIKVGFFFDTKDVQYNGFRGWILDDIAISNSQYGISAFGPNGLRKEIISKPRN